MSIEPGPGTGPEPKGPGTPPGAPQDIERNGRRAMWLALAAVLMMLIPVATVFAVIPAIAAVVLGVRTRRAARRAGRPPAPGSLAGVVVGAIVTVLFVMIVGTQLYLHEEITRYSQCQNAANTIQEERGCRERLARDVEKKFGLPSGTLNEEMLAY
ncbi:hypothetical protein [Thermomonospora cellulosilytica]|uniref:DUF4190 domain-containing protein n=1 Tax=Thermomonospora cellulosilytica TaxID=1411118 RepID=A0A7W3MSP5_9ACTN|nr:hypothetical protein [Thermomonospora cellulosilytica]MBA9001189.1 hypothetical protein [Thermomonospora cellulosilytica]